MHKLKIARIIDQFGWAYHFISKEHAKYSRHQVIPVKYDSVEVQNYDLVYIHSPNISTRCIDIIVKNCKEQNIPVVGGYAGDPAFWDSSIKKNYDYVDLAVGISPETYSHCLVNYPGKAIFMPEPIDDEFFVKKVDRGTHNFVVGWAGGLHKQAKRSHLLNKLKYPIKTQSQWNPVEFVESRTQDHMVSFYNEIDVLVLTSITECQPRVVLEAMSCGKPVVATNVGNIRMLLDKRWIVSKEPDSDVIREINLRLDMLRNNKELLIETGARNRACVEKLFSWNSCVAYWDMVFENVIKQNLVAAISISEMYLANNELKKFLE